MRKGDYCISHIENMRDNECITEKRYQELKDWGVFREGNSEISELSEAACIPMMREKNSEIEAKAIEAVAKNISNGNIPTAKQVKSIIENKRAGVKPGGRIQSGQDSSPEQPTLTMKDFLSVEKNEVGDVEDPEMDMEQDYYSGDAPITPDEQEKLGSNDVQNQPVVADDLTPIDKKTYELGGVLISKEVQGKKDQREEERVAQATKDLKKEKEDERESNEITEKNESNKTKNTLVTLLSGAMRTALHEGITRKEVFEALHIAIDSVFEPIDSNVERKSNGSEPTSGGGV